MIALISGGSRLFQNILERVIKGIYKEILGLLNKSTDYFRASFNYVIAIN